MARSRTIVASRWANVVAGAGSGRPGAGRFVHLSVHQGDLRRAEVVLLNHTRFGHLLVEVEALSGALTHSGEHGHAAVQLGNVVNELHDDHRLAHAGPAKRADLSA